MALAVNADVLHMYSPLNTSNELFSPERLTVNIVAVEFAVRWDWDLNKVVVKQRFAQLYIGFSESSLFSNK